MIDYAHNAMSLESILKTLKEYVTVSDDTLELIKKGIEYGDTSDGRFDITIGKLSDFFGL